MPAKRFVRWFEELSIDDVAEVGGKNASLGEMYRELTADGVRVPNGFATTADAFRLVLDQAGVTDQLRDVLAGLDPDDSADLARRAHRCRDIVYSAEFPTRLRAEILEGFGKLQEQYGEDVTVAVRSSATAEDLPTASFAGQHESYLNVSGGEALIDACHRCFASLFTERGIRYRIDQGFDHFKVALSVGIMKMVRSDRAASGVIFTLDTESSFRDVVFITGSYGLGENVVQGAVDPDEFYVHKPTFRQGHRVVLRRNLGEKKIKMVYGHGRSAATTHNIPTPKPQRRRFCIDDGEVLELAEFALKIEDHYSQQAGYDKPMDIEWAKDADDGELYIVQARPETVASQQGGNVLVEYELKDTGDALVTGRAVGSRIASGRVRVLHDKSELPQFKAGEVLVSDMTTPDWGAVLKRAAAVVTNRGGRTCHAAIVARELGIPAVIGTEDATERLQSGKAVTVSCADGDVGHVYNGELPFSVTETNLDEIGTPRTELMINIGNPDVAFKLAALPCAGVGLARLEFIITEFVKAHPQALLHPDRIEDTEVRAQIMDMARNHASPAAFFVDKVAEGVGTIAAAFYPRPVVVRLSDFKTNEYANLLGGADFEPKEENPMIGFRGASRYTHPSYADAFALECEAMKRVREDMGLSNVRLMIPFCRRVGEAARVLETMAKNGLERGVNDLQVYVMCEIPNNVIQIDAFAEHFDGFSIGSNDLTQLTLGVDRDSDLVAFEFDERDPGILAMLKMAIDGAKRNGRHIGICGQAPSDYPEIAEFLVRAGIDSISLNPDTLLKSMISINEIERELDSG